MRIDPQLVTKTDFLLQIIWIYISIILTFLLFEGRNASLLVTLIGSDIATVTEVTLVESSGLVQVNGTVETQGGGEYIVRFARIPSVEFVVLVKGQNNNTITRASSGVFQRQSTTSLRASVLTVSIVSTPNPKSDHSKSFIKIFFTLYYTHVTHYAYSVIG